MTDDERPEIPIDCTPEEREHWQAAADRAGLPLEDWVIRSVNRRVRLEQVADRFGLSVSEGWWRWGDE